MSPKAKKIFGIVCIVVGAIMLLFSHYIAEQVAEGKIKISRGQSQVNTINSVFSSNPYTKQIGKGVTGSAQKKIDAGQAQVSEYEDIAQKLQIGGVVLIVIGIGILYFSRSNKKKR